MTAENWMIYFTVFQSKGLNWTFLTKHVEISWDQGESDAIYKSDQTLLMQQTWEVATCRLLPLDRHKEKNF